MGQIVQFAKDHLGEHLRTGQLELLEEWDRGTYTQGVWQCGRRSGKSFLADIVLLYDAVVRDWLHLQYQRLVELRRCVVISPRLEQSDAHIQQISGWIESNPYLKSMVARTTRNEIEFKNHSIIQSYPCSGRGIRGAACSTVILDELGHFISTEEGNGAGEKIYWAIRPSLSQFGEYGWLIAISTPRWKQGMFWKLVEDANSKRFPYMHYVKRSTAEMNPTPEILADIAKIKNENPDLFSQEYLANFLDGASSYLSSEDVLACKREGNILSPRDKFRYVAAIDPAYQHDNFALCIGHNEGEKVVIDGVWVWKRAGHEFTIGQIAQLCHEYRVQEVRTDQHAPVPIREALERHRLATKYVPWTNDSKGEACNRLKVNTNTRRLELPDDEALISELLSLEARPTAGGLTRIAAAPGAHDDRAIACASVVQALDRPNDIAVVFAGDPESTGAGWSPEEDDRTDWERLLGDTKAPGWLQ